RGVYLARAGRRVAFARALPRPADFATARGAGFFPAARRAGVRFAATLRAADCFAAGRLAADLRAPDDLPRAADFFTAGFFAADFLAAGFFPAAFFTVDFFAADLPAARIVAGRAATIVAAARVRRTSPSSSAIALPSSAGLFTVRTPACSSARYLSAAVPLPPEITAPA